MGWFSMWKEDGKDEDMGRQQLLKCINNFIVNETSDEAEAAQ